MKGNEMSPNVYYLGEFYKETFLPFGFLSVSNYFAAISFHSQILWKHFFLSQAESWFSIVLLWFLSVQPHFFTCILIIYYLC